VIETGSRQFAQRSVNY